MRLAETTTYVKQCRIVPSKMGRSRFSMKNPCRRLGPPTDKPARVPSSGPPVHPGASSAVSLAPRFRVDPRTHWRRHPTSDRPQRSVSEDQWNYGAWGIFSQGVQTGPRYDNSFLEKKWRTLRAGTACQRYTTLNSTGISPGVLCTA